MKTQSMGEETNTEEQIGSTKDVAVWSTRNQAVESNDDGRLPDQ
jgi:hypothetical protein